MIRYPFIPIFGSPPYPEGNRNVCLCPNVPFTPYTFLHLGETLLLFLGVRVSALGEDLSDLSGTEAWVMSLNIIYVEVHCE